MKDILGGQYGMSGNAIEEDLKHSLAAGDHSNVLFRFILLYRVLP